MSIIRIAAFSDGNIGGNPAGVHISEQHPSVPEMRSIAAEVGYSETAFAEPSEDGWHVRYFSPESEVPFCGHATIALGGALAKRNGAGIYSLALNEANITVEGFVQAGSYSAALQSPNTQSKPADPETVQTALRLFGYEQQDLNLNIPPAFANAGANHLIISLNSRSKFRAMSYDLNAGRTFMHDLELVTVMLVYSETKQLFHTRNPFASGGVYEDPATGAASAAFAGYLRDINWPHAGTINIVQGEDMGSRSIIRAELTDAPGSSVRVSGSVRFMDESEQ
ncbi:PhzF family phenazine biosynthesis protein [Solemya elarraichensis gill symbiont]|uniref:PhzF family phenazine biosynthesis protein n=1 Tax=Solemya elarraichensis gill symbiont TaxID=1918949 RepID=A0A1T2L580_9GAMM|nr:PhzF family phenazine biosynthesis protein [Solemya elarraichensis gill symbiont]OOZ40190.1 PhzF family phenazine biosynthesis protein [Solemya elarraichensis gill symbiont]